jgi:hypothetical protein
VKFYPDRESAFMFSGRDPGGIDACRQLMKDALA